MRVFINCLQICHLLVAVRCGMLKVQESESRSIQEMNGMWNFRADKSPQRNQGMIDKWWTAPLSKTGDVIPMPVPSSFNDITTDRSLQYFTGWVWYDREFFVPKSFRSNRRLILRVDSAHYYTKVWVNGQEVMDHNGGHLPFETEIGKYLEDSGENRVTIAVNNTLTPHTLPPGTIQYQHSAKYPQGYFVQKLQMDFFNYAGIHRRVRLYSTPMEYIDDITIVSSYSGTNGMVNYNVKTGDQKTSNKITVEVLDPNGKSVASSDSYLGSLIVPNVELWWPYSMSKENFTKMYTLKATLSSSDGEVDVYRQAFGIRTIAVTKTQLLINNKPFYCHGVGRHEDSNIRGRALDFPLIARDFNMLRWLGANCFRTSVYPYAEEIMDEADRWGIVIIDESPGIGITMNENFSNISLSHHLSVMEELVMRDKNRPSVVIWAVANEPASDKKMAKEYFRTVISHTKAIDPAKRPVTFVTDRDFYNDLVAEYTDIQCINRYYGWYQDTGQLDTIAYRLRYDLENWYKKLQKPIILSEYGAGTVAGLHSLPSFVFTEDYQVELLEEYHKVLDVYRKEFLVGELVWTFTDFMTDETVQRVLGNKKGLLTRERQPKAAAHVIKRRYWSIINNSSEPAAHNHVLGSNYGRAENGYDSEKLVYRFSNRG